MTASPDPTRLLAQASELMGAFAALEFAGRPGDELAALTLAVERLAGQVHGARLRTIAAFDASGAWERDGAASAASWLRGRVRLNAGSARGLVRDARAVRDALPGFASGLADGEVSADHVRVVAAAIDRYPERRATLPAIEPALAEAARVVDPATLRQLVDRWTTTVDPEHAWEAEQDHHDARAVSLSRTLDGMVAIDGLLDAEGGAALTAALEALVGADRTPDDDRTPRQRRADALVDLARRTLDSGDLPRQGGERPHLQVTIPMALVLDRQAHGAALEGADGSATLTAEAAFRFLCDGALVPVLESADGAVLDVGRSRRTIPPSLRRAVVRRDATCVFAGCHAPPSVCEVHHLVAWAHGGATALDNLALLCRRHHRAVHEDGFVLLGSPRSGLRTIRPDGTPVIGRAVRRLSEIPGPAGPTWGDTLPWVSAGGATAEGSRELTPAAGPDPP